MGNVNGFNWIRKEKRLALYARDRFTCTYCERSLSDDSDRAVYGNEWTFSLDHIVPREYGGTNHQYNLITACTGCNRAKGNEYSMRQMLPSEADYAAACAQVKQPISRAKSRAKQVLKEASNFNDAVVTMYLIGLEAS